jgi:uncharacterized membrane protein (Fun14 family)
MDIEDVIKFFGPIVIGFIVGFVFGRACRKSK